MDEDLKTTQADLAYLKALVSDGGQMQRSSGILFLAAGLLYGFQCLIQGLAFNGLFSMTAKSTMVFVIGVTVVFFIIVAIVVWRSRKSKPVGVAARALNAAFAGAGLTNLAMMGVFGYVAATEHSLTIWLLYPVVVCALQGAAWYSASFIRRKLWLGLVSLGWFVTTLLLGFLIHNVGAYVVVMGVALVLLLALSGAVMVRLAGKAQST